ncbi:hypothetical protein IHO40_00330 [Wolbachia endosymbiont of Mansonella ozzardi]|uniref:hypothetical protein n=1 Tax=Wolbachia endosymbiont of Mansonella ozzardi TaxID=137464 RepID=UPI001CE14AF0|nr:hypothetical protein [Wolbachia endosymbiont of Mansonella ozzardi]MCA4774636.1 hypothetical protein [Wolbachia endosymbiont of Mansonella ozzardi]
MTVLGQSKICNKIQLLPMLLMQLTSILMVRNIVSNLVSLSAQSPGLEIRVVNGH